MSHACIWGKNIPGQKNGRWSVLGKDVGHGGGSPRPQCPKPGRALRLLQGLWPFLQGVGQSRAGRERRRFTFPW